MKKFSLLLSLCLFALMLFSCGDEKVIDSTKSLHSVLAASNESPYVLSLVNIPSNTIEYEDIISQFNSFQLDNPIENILVYRDEIFLFVPESFKIFVLDANSYRLKATIDFTLSNEKPISACFPNATDCYIIHRNGSSVSLLDLTNYTIPRTIQVGKGTSSIAVSGNQIFITNKTDNTVSIVDSRTHTQEAVLNVPSKPAFVDISSDNKKVAIISLGDGKEDTTETKSASMVTIFDVESRNQLYQVPISIGSYKAENQFPNCFSVSSVGYGFIATQQALFRTDIKREGKISLVERGNFNRVLYDYKSDEILVWQIKDNQKFLRYLTSSNGTEVSSFSFNNRYSVFFPLK
ncbi:MAG TPA: hypothetical protein PK762_05735 [Candidatus Kapabacteria bacterium]|nr:hypothetical protein [Candidatus Kapabacteria bacterium]